MNLVIKQGLSPCHIYVYSSLIIESGLAGFNFEASVDEVGDWYNWFGLKYLLYEYELHLSKQKPVLMDWVYLQKKDKQDSIEHILPQTPTQLYWNRWSKKEIDEAIHDIGNLVITFDNSSYGNKGFDQKKGHD